MLPAEERTRLMPYIATLRVEKHAPPRQRGPDNHWGDRQRQGFQASAANPSRYFHESHVRCWVCESVRGYAKGRSRIGNAL